MKHVKMLGLLVMAAASMMAFASSASATPVLTSPAGTEYTGTIHATLETGTTALLKAGIEDTCKESTAHGIVTVNNTEHAEGALTETFTSGGVEPTGLHWGGCTQDTKTITAGSLTINDAGEVFTVGSRVEVKVTGLGIVCFYGAEKGSVRVGTLTGGTTAKLNVSTTTLQRETGSNTTFCALNGTWTASYKVTTPDTLIIT
jgi:hypothetical protein